ncbi:MAG: xylose isomerase, partial [Pseudomonadota bacterium]
MTDFFGDIAPIRFDPEGDGETAFRHYDANEVVLGKRLEDHLRFSVAWWHSFAWPGGDPFGGQTFERPWFGDSMKDARLKADVAFDMFGLLGQPFFCFHDLDIRPEGATFAESADRLDAITDHIGEHMERVGTKLLWGTANMFTNPRFMHGAATSCNADVFAYGAAQVKKAMEVTKRLGGENYVFWGGREGYMNLYNTDMKREIDHLGQFL